MIDVREAIEKLPRELPENLPDDAVVFAGDVAGFGPPPAAWSGRFAMYQTVTFTGVTSLRGDVPKAFDVDVAVVKNSPLALEDTPGLSDEVLSRGSRWIVAAVEDETRKAWALRYVSPWSMEREAAARKFLADRPIKKKAEKDKEKE